jgi:group I intron endonuclease
MIGIYKITSPSKKVYIGQSVNIERRFLDYRKSLKKQQIKLFNSIKKYGYENHTFEVVEECEIKDLNDRERYWQDFYNVISANGLNCRLTKTNDKSGNLSKETIEKLKNKDFSYLKGNSFRKDILHTEEIKQQIKNTLIENSKKDNYVNGMTGKFGVLNPFYGKKHSKKTLEKMRIKPNSKTILNIENGIFYNSIKEASNIYGINYSTLKDNLNNRRGIKNNTNLMIV